MYYFIYNLYIVLKNCTDPVEIFFCELKLKKIKKKILPQIGDY